MGLAVGIHEGNTITRTYGHTEDMVEGNAESVVKGDSYSTTYGATSGMFMGTKNEVTMGIDNEMKLAADTTFLLGGQFEFAFALCAEITTAPVFEHKFFEAKNKTAKVEKEDVKVEANTGATIEKKTVHSGTRAVKIFNETVHLKKVLTKVNGVEGVCIYG